MKLEVRQFVRTKDGIIAKVDYIDNDTIFFDKELYRTYGDSIDFLEKDNLERIVKASYNIIDILEEGDYVNGLKITSIDKTFEGNVLVGLGKNFGFSKFDNDYKITSVVTHEQMEQMAYKVGEWLNELVRIMG